jgi:hypothetical protein
MEQLNKLMREAFQDFIFGILGIIFLGVGAKQHNPVLAFGGAAIIVLIVLGKKL